MKELHKKRPITDATSQTPLEQMQSGDLSHIPRRIKPKTPQDFLLQSKLFIHQLSHVSEGKKKDKAIRELGGVVLFTTAFWFFPLWHDVFFLGGLARVMSATLLMNAVNPEPVIALAKVLRTAHAQKKEEKNTLQAITEEVTAQNPTLSSKEIKKEARMQRSERKEQDDVTVYRQDQKQALLTQYTTQLASLKEKLPDTSEGDIADAVTLAHFLNVNKEYLLSHQGDIDTLKKQFPASRMEDVVTLSKAKEMAKKDMVSELLDEFPDSTPQQLTLLHLSANTDDKLDQLLQIRDRFPDSPSDQLIPLFLLASSREDIWSHMWDIADVKKNITPRELRFDTKMYTENTNRQDIKEKVAMNVLRTYAKIALPRAALYTGFLLLTSRVLPGSAAGFAASLAGTFGIQTLLHMETAMTESRNAFTKIKQDQKGSESITQ